MHPPLATVLKDRAGRPRTRERILDVAAELFTVHGYDKTSLRDIAERLKITKAALYYYFPHKQDILLELHTRLHNLAANVLDELETIPDGPGRTAAWPATIDRLIDQIITNRDLILLYRRNLSAIDTLRADQGNALQHDDLQARLGNILSTDAIPINQRIRMAATIGVVTEILVDSSYAFASIPPQELTAQVHELVTQLLRTPYTSSTATPR